MNEVLRLTLDEIRTADVADDMLAGPGHPASGLARDERSPSGVAVAGIDGYLFIGDGANRWESQFRGELRIPPGWFTTWAELLDVRQRAAARRGLTLWNFIVPEKQVIYPDKRWPGEVGVGRERPVRRLLPHLKSEARVIYPAAELATARAAAPAYFRHNSHWTPSGCCAAMAPLLAALEARMGTEALRFAYRRDHRAQDLSVHWFDPAPAEDTASLVPAAEVFFDNRQLETTGRHAGAAYGLRTPKAPDPRSVIVFGDSFAYDAGLTAALSAVFSQVVFVWSKNVIWEQVGEYGADLVIWESAERFMGTLPNA